jgi:hypothetical protein
MQLTSLSQELLARLLKLEDAASHASVLAAVADNAAWLAHQRADAAQAVLSAAKISVALFLITPLGSFGRVASRLNCRYHAPVPFTL